MHWLEIIFVMACGTWSYEVNAHRFSEWLFGRGNPSDWQAGVWMFMAGMIGGMAALFVIRPCVLAVAAPFSRRGRSGAFWSSTAGRWLTGKLAEGGMMSAAYGILALFLYAAWKVAGLYGLAAVCAVVLFLVWADPFKANDTVKVFIGRKSVRFRRWTHSLSFGYGGSARFAGMLDDWSHRWEPDTLALGASLYDRNWLVGIRDDRHIITMATSRSGKGTSGIIPNLLTYPGSILVIDPKGENAAITAEARRRMGQNVHILDPFKVLSRVGVVDKVSRYNPLTDIDPKGETVYEDIRAIADGLVVPTTSGDPFWDESARDVLAGLIAHARTSPLLREDERHLGTVHKWLTSGAPRVPGRNAPRVATGAIPLLEMEQNFLAGGLPQAVAAGLDSMEPKVQSSVLAAARTHLGWLNSVGMRESLSASDFSMFDLKRKPTTIYLVLPPNLLKTHSRWLRMFITTAISAAVTDAKKPPHDIILLMDEFFSLGRLDVLEASAANLAGYGVKVWPIVQNIGQLEQLYADNWETFLGNASLWQVFAVNDQRTAKYFSDRLGNHVRWQRMDHRDGTSEWLPQGATALRSSVELASSTSRDSGRQFVFEEGGLCHFLRRVDYRERFQAGEYRPNPHNERRPVDEPAGEAEESAA